MKIFQSLARTPTEELVELARVAEDLGFAGVSLSDHLVRPVSISSSYPYSADGLMAAAPETHYPDVWVAAAAIAQATTRLNVLSSVYILPARDPFTAAKALATAAVLSGDRVMIGVGLGWMREEFELTGQAFEGRGARTDEMLTLIEKLLRPGPVEHQGRFYTVPPLHMAPTPRRVPPILVGGHSEAALRRAARHDGWIGVNYPRAEVPARVAQVLAARAAAGERAGEYPFEVALAINEPLDRETIEHLAEVGVTLLIHPPAPLDPTRRDLAARRRHLEALARIGLPTTIS